MTEKMIVSCPECRTRFVAPLEKFLPDGRRVRCAKCGHAWFQEAEAAIQRVAVKSEEEAEAPRRSMIEESVARSEASKESAAPPLSSSDDSRSKTISPAKDGIDETSRLSAVLAASTYRADTARIARPRRGGWLRAVLYCLAALIIAGALAYFFREPLSSRFPTLAEPLSNFSGRVDRVVSSVMPPARHSQIENVTYKFTDIENGQAMLLTADVVNDSDQTLEAPKLAMKAFSADNTVLHEAVMVPEDMTADIKPKSRTGYFLRIPHPPEGIKRVEVDFADAI